MTEIIITKHAYKRAKERLSWKKKTLNRMATKAYAEGVTHRSAKGHLKGYIGKLFIQHKTANNIRVYGQDVYLFNAICLITIFRIPNNLLKTVEISK